MPTILHLPPSRYRTTGSAAVSTEESAIYTVREVAGLLRLSLGSTYTLVREGEIPAKKMGARWVIPKKRFHAWLDECTARVDQPTWGERH